ncbi:MAG: CapA family protein [Candidatus Lokiarchaeota archaeon]|nr:CapA family protein [Candidatus Lokiarchaeota archaeon]
MVLKAPNGRDLTTFYNQNPGLTLPCQDSDETDWWRLSPYNREETKNYVLKLIALPLVASAAFFFIFILSLFSNPIIHLISTILVFIAALFFNSYTRELIRANRYEITVADGLIDVPIPYDINQEASLFKFNLNTIQNPHEYTLGFLGDIMMINNHELDFDPLVLQFFSDVDLIVGNLEGIVRASGDTLGKQAHCPSIFRKLQGLLGPNKPLLLCLSNNHSSDYGNREFDISLELIRNQPQANIHVFGRHDTPNVTINGFPINIATATQWSNQKNWECISEYTNTNVNNGFGALHKDDHVNIFFPHWSYENEKYTRDDIQDQADTLLTGNAKRWDLIFGQHSHTRQPIQRVTDPDSGLNKLVVFSGGNFTSGAVIIREQRHIYGIIMKCRIGLLPGSRDQYAIGDVEWRKTYNDRHIISGTKTICIDREKYRINRIYSLILGIAVIGLVVLLKVLELFGLI